VLPRFLTPVLPEDLATRAGIGLILLSLVESVISLSLYNHDHPKFARRMDKICVATFFLAYVIGNVLLLP
jgi:hypothetical protein